MEWNEMPIQIMNTFDPKMKKVFPHEQQTSCTLYISLERWFKTKKSLHVLPGSIG